MELEGSRDVICGCFTGNPPVISFASDAGYSGVSTSEDEQLRGHPTSDNSSDSKGKATCPESRPRKSSFKVLNHAKYFK